MRYKTANIEDLKGKVITKAYKDMYDEALHFHTSDGQHFIMHHVQDCCEDVTIEDICGDLDDLVGGTVFIAEERTNREDGEKDQYDESYTWTFYEICTNKGGVSIRWYGSSNGYYSEEVNFDLVEE